jgi:uncharacterized surface protein with fasciclin (FAS1) repeats
MLALLAISVIPSAAQDEAAPKAHLRVAHFAADAPAVDVFSKGVVVLRELAFGTVSDWLELDPGAYNIRVSPTGQGLNAAVISLDDFEVAADEYITVAAIGTVALDTIRAQVIKEDDSNIGIGNARVTIFHAAEGVPAVDVLADGSPLVSVLSFPGTLGSNDGLETIEVPAGIYNLQVRATGSTDPGDIVADLPETEFALNGNYLIAAIGTVDAPQVVTASRQLPYSIIDVLVGDGRFGTLLAAIDAAGMTETLDTGGPYTLLAPSDGAFNYLFETRGVTAEELLANTEALTIVLNNHVIEGAVDAETIAGMETVTTLAGNNLNIEQTNLGLVLQFDVHITRSDIAASNGIVHIVNRVILPLSVEL